MGFIGRSLLVLSVLYGLLFLVVDLFLLHGGVPLWYGIAFILVLFAIQYLVSPWLIEWFFSIDWSPEALPAVHRAFVENLCRERGLPPLKLGVIWSGTPNAFAFGRVRRDARVVVTEGVLKNLTTDEINAVLAHEVGHVAHYDFAVMALASICPLLLYQVYIWTDRVNNLRIVSYAAYLAYWVGQFLVLMLNRTREFGADHFSAEVTRQPSVLSSALVKIAYGMIRETSEARRLMKEGASADIKKDGKRALQFGQSLSLMGIAAASAGQALALVSNTPEAAAKVMRWDLVNPWSRVYQLGSTHPLTAMRIKALNRDASSFGQQAEYPLPTDSQVRWSGFPLEFLFWAAPLVCAFVIFSYGWIHKSLAEFGIVAPHSFMPRMFLALGITWAARIAYRYRGAFVPAKVGDLLEDMSVSQMRPRAVELEGEIIGHGIPGAAWSADLVLQDDSGMMFVYYRSSLPFGRLFFAVTKADDLIGERVKLRGWYRRGMRPFIELSRIEGQRMKIRSGRGMTSLFSSDASTAPVEYEPVVSRSYSVWIQLAASAACVAFGIFRLLL
jgi:Zn-dependent protease with chaperone function